MHKLVHAPSIANCDFLHLGKQIADLIRGGCECFHFDIIDGHYVPNLCFPVKTIADFKKHYPNKVADVHLMVKDPMNYFEMLREAGADYVCFHIDSTSFVLRALTRIRELGMKAGVAINPSQRIDSIEPYLAHLDFVLLMTVEPGFMGQTILPGSLDRIEELGLLRARHNANFWITVDGGVGKDKLKSAAERGANIIVGSIHTVFSRLDDLENAFKEFEMLVEEARRTVGNG